MIEDSRPSPFELSPDGYLRRLGKVVELPRTLEGPADPHILGSREADAEAARRYLQMAQTPLQTVSISRPNP